MRRFLAVAFLIPSVCLALGADSEMYLGIAPDGKIIKVKFSADVDWTDHKIVYGSSVHPRFRYCWSPAVDSPSAPSYFVCSPEERKTPSVFYRSANWDHERTSSPRRRYKEAMSLFKKLKIDKDTEVLLDYYICEKGCDSTMPTFIFEVGFGGM